MRYTVKQAAIEIGSRLRELRIALGYSQAEVARVAGVTAKTISRWERGKGRMGWYSMVEIAKMFDTSFEFLCMGREDPVISRRIVTNLEETPERSYVAEVLRDKKSGELYGRRQPIVL